MRNSPLEAYILHNCTDRPWTFSWHWYTYEKAASWWDEKCAQVTKPFNRMPVCWMRLLHCEAKSLIKTMAWWMCEISYNNPKEVMILCQGVQGSKSVISVDSLVKMQVWQRPVHLKKILRCLAGYTIALKLFFTVFKFIFMTSRADLWYDFGLWSCRTNQASTCQWWCCWCSC